MDFRIDKPQLRILDLSYNKILYLTYDELLFSPYHFNEEGNATTYVIHHNLTVDLRNNLITRIELPHKMVGDNVFKLFYVYSLSWLILFLGIGQQGSCV